MTPIFVNTELYQSIPKAMKHSDIILANMIFGQEMYVSQNVYVYYSQRQHDVHSRGNWVI